MSQPNVNEIWRFKRNRGTGSFTVINVAGGRVKLRPRTSTGPTLGKDKTISVKTLRGDYERVETGA